MSHLKSNFHIYSDRTNQNQQFQSFLLQAETKKMEALGFLNLTKEEFSNLLAVKERCSSKIDVFRGLEQEYFSANPELPQQYDYSIGTVHFLQTDGILFPLNESQAAVSTLLQEHFHGDMDSFLQRYFETVVNLPNVANCQIISDFAVFEKWNAAQSFFDSNHLHYRRAALEALDALLEKDLIFEVDTCQMAQGLCNYPLPNIFLLRRIAEKRGRIMLSSKTDRPENLMFGYEKALAYLHACGIGGCTVFTSNGFKTIPI